MLFLAGGCITSIAADTKIAGIKIAISHRGLSLNALQNGEEKMNDKHQACILACQACIVECERCIAGCLEHPEHMGSCIRTCLDCIDLCRLCISLMARGSALCDDICKICAKACKACAESCEKHAAHHACCKVCAEACRACAETCEACSGECC